MHLCLGTTPTVQQTMIFTRVVPDEVNRAVEVRRSASGKPTNVARALRTLGDEAMLCVPLGGDTGRFMRADLDAARIAHDCVETGLPTRTCVTVIDRSSGVATELVEEAQRLSGDESARMLEKLVGYLPQCRMVILSGTLAPGVGEDFYGDCCGAAAKAGVGVILDARGTPLIRALRFRPLVVKPNRAELSATIGKAIDGDASLREAMMALHSQGAQWVLITMGKRGAVLTDGSRFWKIPPLKIEVVSAIGSGDAFSGGLGSAIAEGREIPDACRLATACAAANALVPGSGLFRLEDVRRLEGDVRVDAW